GGGGGGGWGAPAGPRPAPARPGGGGPDPHRVDPPGRGAAGPAGAKASTAAGRAGIAEPARPLVECPPHERGRGRLELALTASRQADERGALAQAKLDELGKADRRVRLLDPGPGLGPPPADAGGA